MLLAAAALLLGWAAPASAGDVRYRETVGEDTVYFTWRSETAEDILVTVHREAARFVNRLTADGDTLAWGYRSEGIEVQAERLDNQLRIWGRVDDTLLQERYPIDADPWYQPLSYSLRGFLQSDRQHVRFWTIRLDELEPVKLKAAKIGTETIETPAGRFEARKVEVRLDGWLSFAWHGIYWYRKSDGLFLKYRGVNGLPGTPPTVIELMEIGS